MDLLPINIRWRTKAGSHQNGPPEARMKGLAVITGGSSGFGAATAPALARLGHPLLLGARRLERLEAVRASVLAEVPGAQVEVERLDVTDPGSCEAFARRAASAEVVVHSAGLARGADPVVSAAESDWREMLETNVMGMARLTRLLLPGMIARKAGTIVILGSVAALEPYPGGSFYGASKAGVRVIAKSLRHELLGTGIRVCNVEPGAADTEFSVVRFHGDAQRASSVYQGFTPLSAADVAEVIAFAVSRPPHVTLEEIVVYPTAQAGTRHTHRG
jgi:3-hydroxy acid dehydrogenase/malonic semialdehyde reductase